VISFSLAIFSSQFLNNAPSSFTKASLFDLKSVEYFTYSGTFFHKLVTISSCKDFIKFLSAGSILGSFIKAHILFFIEIIEVQSKFSFLIKSAIASFI
jgi:hypothetical protein